jgi:hypothetical protein
MGWFTKYKVEYSDRLNFLTTIELQLDLPSQPTIIELIGGSDPVVLQMPEGKLFEGIHGGGATLSLIVPDGEIVTPNDFYSPDPHYMRVTIQKDTTGNGVVDSILFYGWVNPEIYEEQWTQSDNYEITLECNDGLASLDKYEYANGYDLVTNEPIPYEGELIVGSVIERCLLRLDLPYNKVFTLSQLAIDVQEAGTLTILRELLVQQSNYYKENGDAMTYKGVLSAILVPLGLTLFIEGAKIYIMDITEMAGNNHTGYECFLSCTPYRSETLISVKDVPTDVTYRASGTTLELQPAITTTKLTYNAYAGKFVENTDWSNTDTHVTGPVIWSQVAPNLYVADYTSWQGVSGWTANNYTPSEPRWLGIKENNLDAGDFYITQPFTQPYGSSSIFLTSNAGTIHPCHGVDNRSLSISCKAFFRNNNWYEDPTATYTTLQLLFKIKIGGTYVLVGGNDLHTLTYQVEDKSKNVAQTWQTLTGSVPVDSTVSGDVIIEIVEATYLSYTNLLEIAVRDIDIVTIDTTTRRTAVLTENSITSVSEVAPNVDYIANKGAFTITHGDSSDRKLTDKGGFLNHLGNYATDFYKIGDVSRYNLLSLILDNREANTEVPRSIISATLTADDILIGGTLPFGKTSALQFPNELPNKRFTLMGGDYSDKLRQITGRWQEVYNERV